MKLCWLIPDDRGGGVISLAQACCQEASQYGHEVTLLVVLTVTGRISNSVDFRVASLNREEPALDTPSVLIDWLRENPQDILFLNGCEQADAAIAYLPNALYCVYVIHDTAPRYWKTALKQERNLDRIVTISEIIAHQFQHRLSQPQNLVIIHNGCHFPILTSHQRENDLMFLGGDNPRKGAFDILHVWKQLMKLGFKGRLHWFGSLSPAFQLHIKQLPGSSQIGLYGHAPRDAIFNTAAQSKVLLMMSRVESFGMATIEAMGMGCVPIAWDIATGTQEIVGQSQTGVLVPLGNTRQVAQHVLHVCQHHSVFEDAVVTHARMYFHASVMGRKYEALLQSITSQPAVHRGTVDQHPPRYQPPIRLFQLLPSSIRHAIRMFVGRLPRLEYWLRDLRGW